MMKRSVTVFILFAMVIMVAATGCKRKARPGDEMDDTIGEGIALGELIPIEEFVEAEDAAIYSDIYFDYDRSLIKENAVPTLKMIAEDLASNSGRYLLIEGHCDERGDNEYNLALGERRALRTREYLINLGVEAERIITISYGEEEPVDPRHNEDAWSMNRRAHFKISE
jgi:peptidoglycan-associated lipoprotein